MFDSYLKHNRKKRKLQDIIIDEISLVTKGSNRKRFAIIKKAEEGLDLVLKDFLADDEDMINELLSKAKDPAEAMKATLEALKILKPYLDEGIFPLDAVKALKTLAAFAAGSAASGSDYGYPAKDQPDEKAKGEGGDELHFYKGGVTQADCWLSGMLAWARENHRRANPREDSGYLVEPSDLEKSDDDEVADDEDHVQKGISQALPGQEDIEDAETEPDDNFPSLQLPVFPRDRVVRGRVL